MSDQQYAADGTRLFTLDWPNTAQAASLVNPDDPALIALKNALFRAQNRNDSKQMRELSHQLLRKVLGPPMSDAEQLPPIPYDMPLPMGEALMAVGGYAPASLAGLAGIYELPANYKVRKDIEVLGLQNPFNDTISISPLGEVDFAARMGKLTGRKRDPIEGLKETMAHETGHRMGLHDRGPMNAYDISDAWDRTREDVNLPLEPGQQIDPRIQALQKTLTTKKKQ